MSLPIAFDDSQTRAGRCPVHTENPGGRPELRGGNNIDYAVRYNGLSDREELYETALAASTGTRSSASFPGCLHVPARPAPRRLRPKYNPTRTWTPEGAFGLGGPLPHHLPRGVARRLSAHRTDAPDLRHRGAEPAFAASPLLIRAGDRVASARSPKGAARAAGRTSRHDRYRYEIVETDFDVGAYLEWPSDGRR